MRKSGAEYRADSPRRVVRYARRRHSYQHEQQGVQVRAAKGPFWQNMCQFRKKDNLGEKNPKLLITITMLTTVLVVL